MGNSNTKESRPGDAASRGRRPSQGPSYDGGSGPSGHAGSVNRNRVSRGDLTMMLGITSPNGSTSAQQSPQDRRETKQEREARRLEKERLARIKERERSIREEHVDGGYLVTMGTYVGPEDFNKQIVRQLQIDRKIAPFWRGLNDKDDNWTEFQIIAAARGLPIPPPDQTPPEELIPRPLSSQSPVHSNQNLNNLTVPMGGRTQSTASDHSASNSGSALPSPVSATSGRSHSPFRPRGKSLAAVLGGSSRNASSTDIAPREIHLPNDPFVNGQPLEVFLYKDATECPICFLTYPPYLNHTRCCDQPICSECFVQIKRPDPHYPEGHNENDPNTTPEESVGLLVSEPACCPYCTQPDFGVTYEPPPFRRGLAHAISSSTLGSMNTAMSSSSSLNSGALSPTHGSGVTHGNRRRTQSLSANAPNVVLTDKIRPDWSTKLQAARAHQARRAAAATALHTAAFLMGNAETRPFRVSRFGRRNTGSGSASPGGAGAAADHAASTEVGGSGTGTPVLSPPSPGPRGSSGRGLLSAGPSSANRRSRMEDLEDMMFMEAIRLSLAAEEERKRKAEKEERKEAKRREKEERKAAKAAAKHGPYDAGDGRSGHSSASGSSHSLSLGFGRKRGNSGASGLRVEASVANAVASTSGPGSPVTDASFKDKGKAVERSLPSTPEVSQDGAEDHSGDPLAASSSTLIAGASTPRPILSHHQPAGPSHLRQMSSASSVSSSLPDSHAGSYSSPSHLQDPTASGTSLAGASEDGGDHDRDPSASTEPMFNFRSLAEVVGVSLEGEHAGRRISRIEAEKQTKDLIDTSVIPEETKQDEAHDAAEVERIEDVGRHADKLPEPTISVSPPSNKDALSSHLRPPEVTITPETPAPTEGNSEESKQLGYNTSALEQPHQVTQ